MKQTLSIGRSIPRESSETLRIREVWPVTPETPAHGIQAKGDGSGHSVESASYRAMRSVADPSVWLEYWLRGFDILASILILFGVWPLMLLLPLLIRLTSRGPAIYRQQRVGRHHEVFTLYKFRTMVDGAERDTGPVWASAQDHRVTPVGRILRRTRMDELPQLFNVLRGDMSLVGPRPERPHFVAQYKALQGIRLSVRPGITGLAQMRGDYCLKPERKLRYDLLYIHNRSLLLNVYILILTLSVVCKRTGW
jgi:lipopolysaccharide/colanic/teichoic acid biosynthesis glycosyltransferase